MLNQPSLVIAIDCWKKAGQEFTTDNWEQVISNISKFCTRSWHVKSVAISTFTYNDQNFSLDQPWIDTAQQFFYNETKWDLLRRMWRSIDLVSESQTHPLLLSTVLRKDQVGFALFNSLQTLYYCNYINPSIRNIYVCGHEWDICVKNRPTGWFELLAMVNANMFTVAPNILIKKSCCGHAAGVFEPDPKVWIRLDQDTFLLNTNYNYT